MLCPIWFGNCSFAYLFIFGAFLTELLEDYLLSFDDINSNFKYNIFLFLPILKKHKLIRLLYKELGFIIFGLLFFYLQKRKNEKKKKQQTYYNVMKKSTLYYIEYLKRNQSISTIKALLIICSLYPLQSIIRKLISFFKFSRLDFWVINIIFISIFMHYFFIINIYKHHKYSLIFVFCTNFILFFSQTLFQLT